MRFPQTTRGRCIAAAAGALLVAVIAFSWVDLGDGGSAKATPTHVIERGIFRLSHFEAGEIRAAEDEKVVSPEVHAQLKITYLWPEGEKVEIGDLILRFDRSEIAEWVKNEADQLEKAMADRDKMIANQEQGLADLATQIEQAKAAVELAGLSLQRAEYAMPILKEERLISLAQAERKVAQSAENLQARKIVNRVERANLELRISHHEKRYDKARKDYDRLTVFANRPGIVVYEVIRKRGTDRRGKVTKGDVVWGGTSLLSLPDLSAMQVVSQVGEMDVTVVQPGQRALIRLEAFPGPVFHGEVRSVAPIATEVEDAPNVQVFEMVIDIEEEDDRLYPGMSASVEIIAASVPDVLLVPLSAVRKDDGSDVVYRLRDGEFTPVQVILGHRNATEAEVESGLAEGDLVAVTASSALL